LFGLATFGALSLLPGGTDGPLLWWIWQRVLTPAHLLPLVGAGVVFGLVRTSVSVAGAFVFAGGIAFGLSLHRDLLDPLWAIPNAAENAFLTGPAASVAVGLALLAGARQRAWAVIAVAFVAGVLLALEIVVIDPSLNDPTNRMAGIGISSWIVAVVALCLRAVDRAWFDIAGRIFGSWLVAIGLLYGGAAFAPRQRPPPDIAPAMPPDATFQPAPGERTGPPGDSPDGPTQPNPNRPPP
jgi:hypothetical protein